MQLVAGFSTRRSGFDVGPVHVRFVVEKVALTHLFLRVLQDFRVSNPPPLLHTYHHTHVTLTRGNSKSGLRNVHKVMLARKSGDIG
jgi:hypothetical protein